MGVASYSSNEREGPSRFLDSLTIHLEARLVTAGERSKVQ